MDVVDLGRGAFPGREIGEGQGGPGEAQQERGGTLAVCRPGRALAGRPDRAAQLCGAPTGRRVLVSGQVSRDVSGGSGPPSPGVLSAAAAVARSSTTSWASSVRRRRAAALQPSGSAPVDADEPSITSAVSANRN
ncbi:hypothetical protein ACWGJV_38165 [Streptomyces tendae]